MSGEREKLTNMFTKVMAGTVTREEGTMLINHLVRSSQAEAVKELSSLIETPPPGVFPKTILHTVSLSRNKALHNIIIAGLEHKNEEVSILAAQELASQKTVEAKGVLVEHLDSEMYHVRKASAIALAKGFTDGLEILRRHILEHKEPFYRSTSVQALMTAGKDGIETLLGILSTGNTGAMETVSEVLVSYNDAIAGADLPKIFDALLKAGDRKDSSAIIALLKVVGALGARARGYEGFVMVFTDHQYDVVRKEATSALKRIRA